MHILGVCFTAGTLFDTHNYEIRIMLRNYCQTAIKLLKEHGISNWASATKRLIFSVFGYMLEL